MLFREGRRLGMVEGDPTIDLRLPPRSPLATRALTDDEIELCRAYALDSLTQLRRPLAWALSEATGRTSEIYQVRVRDVDLAGLRVYLRGSTRVLPRWAPLTGWGAVQVNRRLRARHLGLDPDDRLIVWQVKAPKDPRGAATMAVIETLRAAGIHDEPDVRPPLHPGLEGSAAPRPGRVHRSGGHRPRMPPARPGRGDHRVRLEGWPRGGPAVSGRMLPASSLETIEAILENPSTYAHAEQIPDKGPVGRPRKYPAFMWILFHALRKSGVWRSSRQIEAELAHPHIWGFIREKVQERFPEDPSMWLPAEPMRRCHYAYARRYLKDPAVLESQRRVGRERAVALARKIELLDPDGPGSLTHPDPSRVIQADGKVITPLYKAKPGDTRVDRVTGEVLPVRYDPDASSHVQGDGNMVWGSKFVIASTRSEHDRVILDVAYVPTGRGTGGEPAVAMDCFEQLAGLAPGVQAVAYDMALRGKHIDRIMREFGWLAVTRVPAAQNRSNRRGQRTGPYVEKERLIEVRTLPDGGDRSISLYARAGALGIDEVNEVGDRALVPLQRTKTVRRGNKRGGYRFYNEYRLPPEQGDAELRVRLTGDEEDERKGLNRAENLRAIPPSDPDFARLYARRNDAESINRAVEDSLYLGRAQSVGHLGQLADLIGFALVVNSLTLARHRARERLRAAA
jgi:hypothetical protein